MNYISLGYDCSTASILRELGLRKFALPFDWIRSSCLSIYVCIEDGFSQFHQNLKLSSSRTYLYDTYGFEFCHDYPTISDSSVPGEGIIGESRIADDWEIHSDTVLEKYKRRIERFHNILRSPEPIIALFFGNTSDVYMLKAALLEAYNKTNIIYVVNSPIPSTSEDIIRCNGSKEDWAAAIKDAEDRSKHFNGLP